MWDTIRSWYIRNQDAITWFLIGWLVFAGLDAFIEQRYVAALIDFALAYGNYKFSEVRMY